MTHSMGVQSKVVGDSPRRSPTTFDCTPFAPFWQGTEAWTEGLIPATTGIITSTTSENNNSLVSARWAFFSKSSQSFFWVENSFYCPPHHDGNWTRLNEVLKNGG